jgi:hypothetical protein
VQMTELFKTIEEIPLEFAPLKQVGPLRLRDKSMRCASRGCASPTYVQVSGTPYCMMHALHKLNERLVEVGVLS